MSRPQKIQISDVKARTTRVSNQKRYITRWRVDGSPHSATFTTKAEAIDLHSRLIQARREGQRFELETGRPTSLGGSSESFFDHAASWLEAEWGTWMPRSRRSALEQAVEAVSLARSANAPAPPAAIYKYMTLRLNPDVDLPTVHQEVPTWKDCERWLRRHSLALAALDTQAARRLHSQLANRRDPNDKRPRKPNTINRLRTGAHQIIIRAVDDGKIPTDPWPRPKSGRKRVTEKVDHHINPNDLHSPAEVLSIISHMESSRPASKGYQLLTEISYMLGTRPAETRALHAEDLSLPDKGWGTASIHQADSGDGVLGPTKTGDTRLVPIPPVLVSRLREWLDGRTSGLVVATDTGRIADEANWRRAMRRGARLAGVAPMTPQQLRPCCATNWLNAGAHSTKVAERLGHTLDTLNRHYFKAMKGDDEQVNILLEKLYDDWFQ